LTKDAARHTSGEFDVRPFRWDDIDALFQLERAVRGHPPRDVETAVQAFRAGLRLPRADPERNVLLAESEGKLFGYARIDLELNIGRAVAWLRVVAETPGDRTARALIESAAARARRAGAQLLHVPIAGARDGEFDVVPGVAGMRVVRRQWQMRRPALPVDATSLPEGVRVRPFEPGKDEPVLTKLQNAVFTGSWGYSPNTVNEVTARLELPGYGPGGVLFLESGAGPVAYCWTCRRNAHSDAAGAIHMMGVQPESRGRGFGRLVAALGIGLVSTRQASEVELEVDSANNAAVSLYRELGFERVSDVLWYERRLTA